MARKQTLTEAQASWYQKLRQTGFKDIEDSQGRLHTWSISFINTKPIRQDRIDYFRLAAQFLHDKKFPSKQAKLIWSMHSEGLSRVFIAKKLRLGESKVRAVIEKLRNEFFNED